MEIRSRRLRVLGALALVTGLFGPLAAGSPAGNRAHAAPARAGDGILRIADEGVSDLASIDPPNPSAGDAQSSIVEALVFGGLVRLDQNLNIQPDAASSWKVSGDGKVYTFTLRPGLKWSDGTPVTAADVVWSFNRDFSPAYATGNVGFYLASIAGGTAVANGKAKTVSGIKAIGTNQVQFTLVAPAAVFLNDLAYDISYLVPRAQATADPKNWTDHAVGTGPFMVKQWKHNQEIDLVPNPNYWRGKPKLAGVNVEFIKNTETAYNLYNTGAVDIMGLVNFPGNHLKDALGKPGFHSTPQLFTEFLVLNEKHTPLNNPLVREALSYAINRVTVAKLLKDRFLPAHGMLPPGMPGYNKSQAGQVYDPAKAQALLAKAGYPGGKGFPKLTINVDGGDNDGETKAVAYTEFWKQVLGITVGINQLEHGAYISALTGHNFDIATIQWGADYPDPNDFLSLIWQTGAGANNGFYSNAQFDALTKQADTMPHDSPARFQKYRQAETIMLNQAGGIMMLWGRANVLLRPTIHGLQLTALGGAYLLAAPNWANVTIS